MIDLRPHIPPGSGIWWGQASAEPRPLVDALLDQAPTLGGLTAFSGLTWNPRLGQDLPDGLTVQSYGGLGTLRSLSKRGQLDVVPCHYSALPRLFALGHLPCDVGLVQVSPPDSDGLVSLGIGVEYVADALRHTSTVIAEINTRMPTTRGTAKLPMSMIAATIETDRPLDEAPGREPDDIDRGIAKHVASLVNDGDTIQLGVGSLPTAVLEALNGHNDLGIHTGMITDGVLDLLELGVVTGARKEIDNNLVVTGAALGSRRLYDQLDEHPIEFRPASYTHAPSILSALRSLVSVNSALEVDLAGNVGAETLGGTYVGAIGGQVDFSRAASTTGARSIIALRSEVNGRSTIVATLRGLLTTSRSDIDAVVTEHGAALLTGCSIDERAERLIAVAAPNHREELTHQHRGNAS